LDRLLVDLASGEISRLIIQMPPRHGKSMLTSIYFPAWYLGTFPERSVILASYEHDLAAKWGEKARGVLREWGERLWGVRVRRDRGSADHWEIGKSGGEMICTGVGGPLTGHGADALLVDDPVKNAEEAASLTMRDKTWDWFRSTALTRLHSGGAAVLIMTRWHEDDLVGRVLANQAELGEQWTVLSFPAIAEADDPLGREPGEPLWPERFPSHVLEERRRDLGAYFWQALYQQRPAPPEGALFRRSDWRYYEQVPGETTDWVMSVDSSFKDTDDSSYVVIQVWARNGANVYLIDQWRDRADFNVTCEAVRAMADKHPRALRKLIEDKANGPAIISTLGRQMPGIVAVNPQGGKVPRAQSILPLVEAHNVYLPKHEPWAEDFVNECASFPKGLHDDQVDAMTQALVRWAPRVRPAQPTVLKPEPLSYEALVAKIRRRGDRPYLQPAHGIVQAK